MQYLRYALLSSDTCIWFCSYSSSQRLQLSLFTINRINLSTNISNNKSVRQSINQSGNCFIL